MIHFAHANGFPANCYQEVFKRLACEVDVSFIPLIGHNDNFPITENWSYLIDEVIDSICRQANKPVIGVGHSLGGVLTLLASFKCPELFSKVILLDAPLFTFSKSNVIKLIKKLGLMHLVTPSKKTKNRVNQWASEEEVRAYLLTKKIYQNFNAACLDDFIKYGLVLNPDKTYGLIFNREKESRIYRTVPHNMHRLAVINSLPISLIYSRSSHIIKKYDLIKMKKKYKINTVSCKGSHLFPFEYPEETAKLILSLI